MKNDLSKTIKDRKWIIGMVHVGALPGTPANFKSVKEIISDAVCESAILRDFGVDALLIENMHDVPYLNCTIGPEIVSCMTAVAVAIREKIKLPLGVQILAAANKESLAVAQAANLNFIRAEGFVFAHVADEGYIESCAGDLLRYRKYTNAEGISIFTDIKKKHAAHSLTADVSLKECIETAEYFRSDGIVITGTSTGKEALIEDVEIARNSCSLPIIVGSGITELNVENYWTRADAFIVGSYFKVDGKWQNKLSSDRIAGFMRKVSSLREQK